MINLISGGLQAFRFAQDWMDFMINLIDGGIQPSLFCWRKTNAGVY